MKTYLRTFPKLVAFAIATCALAAQQQTEGSMPAFETASIRPSHMTPGCFSMQPPGGTQYALTCASFRNLIEFAYNASYIVGDEHKLDAYYDVRAITPHGTPWTPETVRPMLQSMLAERFHLATHPGKRDLRGYELLLAKEGSRLHTSDPRTTVQGQKAGEPSQNFVAPGYVQGRGMTAAQIASALSIALREPVVNRTGLSGIFDVDLRYAPVDSTDSTLPAFTTALEEQLGLKLKAGNVTVDTLVIDHIDDAPTPN